MKRGVSGALSLLALFGCANRTVPADAVAPDAPPSDVVAPDVPPGDVVAAAVPTGDVARRDTRHVGRGPRQHEASQTSSPHVAGGGRPELATSVQRFGITVSDLEASVRFFEGLDFDKTGEAVLDGPTVDALVGTRGAKLRVASMRLGTEVVQLRRCVPKVGRSVPASSRSNDAAFQHLAIVVRDMDTAFARARLLPGFHSTSPGPQTIPLSNPNAGGIRAAYFKDAEGHPLELIWFPPGRGKPRWQLETDELFLGIDHSAIAIANTANSERFYAALGFEVAGRALNYGTEQALLSGVPNARVEITGLHAASGPGVEFLQYVEPGPGAPALAARNTCDAWHWETVLEVQDVERACHAVKTAGSRCFELPVSSGVYLPRALTTDPDGHVLALLD